MRTIQRPLLLLSLTVAGLLGACAQTLPPLETLPSAPALPEGEVVYRVPLGDAHQLGPADAAVTWVVYSDFECPFCGRIARSVHALRERHPSQLRVVFKHMPLPFHPNARPAAAAAEAAGAQGKFWEMHDRLFEHQKRLSPQDLLDHAVALGLDLSRFKADLEAGAFNAKIDAHVSEAARFGVRGTPHSFVNGRPVRGAQPTEVFAKIIEEELKRAEAMGAAGVPRAMLYAALTRDGEAQARKDPPKAAPDRPRQHRFADALPGDGQRRGSPTPKVVIIEYSDYECPFCGRVESTVEALLERYPDDLAVVYKHLPLTFHKNAGPAAEAAEAAGAQGMFWEYHALLFKNRRALGRADLEGYATQLGLDMVAFSEALDAGTYQDKIEAHATEANAQGLRGTPSFTINGRVLIGAQPQPAFQAIIDEEIAKADRLLAEGVLLEEVPARLLELNRAEFGPEAP